MPTLVVPASRNGPAGSGNGGWTAGALAAFLRPARGDCVTVRLRQPPPLETPLQVLLDEGVATAVLGTGTATGERGERDVVLEARAEPCEELPALQVVPRVDDDTARAVQVGYRGAQGHPFPTCFACGPDRPVGDGLHLRPGPLPDHPETTACTWLPGPDVDAPTVWAALDCPGGWSVDLAGRPMVLGTMTATVDRLPAPGEACVVMGCALEREGRKARTATTLWSGDQVLARATAVWLAVDPAMFSGLA